MMLPDNPASAVDAILASRQPAIEQLVADLVAVNSQIPPYGDEREIADALHGACRDLGLPVPEVIALDPCRPNLVIRIPGSGQGPTLALNGHIDTKPVGDAADLWRTDPFVATRVGSRIYGLGTSDMKAAVASMLHAAAAIRDCGVRLLGDLVIVLVADEEAGAFFGARHVAPLLADEIDACLIGEPSGWTRDWEGLHVISRGVCCFETHVSGTQMHSSLSDRMPSVNANLEMARLMLDLRDRFNAEPIAHEIGELVPTINAGVTARGGVFYGVVPGDAAFGTDIRTVPGMTEAEVTATIERWAASHSRPDGPAVRIQFDPVLRWIPYCEIPVDHALVTAAGEAMATVLREPPRPSMFPGTTDAPWFAAQGIPTIPSLGPGILTYCHGPNEFVAVEAIHEAARIYARIIMGYCGVESSGPDHH